MKILYFPEWRFVHLSAGLVLQSTDCKTISYKLQQRIVLGGSTVEPPRRELFIVKLLPDNQVDGWLANSSKNSESQAIDH